MLASVAPLIEIAKLNRRLLLNCTDGMDDPAAARRPSERTNNAVFLAVHVVDARYYLAKLLGSELVSPFAESMADVRSVEDLADPPAMSAIRAAWRPVSDDLPVRLERLTEEAAGKEQTQAFPVEDRSLLGVTAFLLQHESYHIGQLALLRKYVGLEPMTYG